LTFAERVRRETTPANVTAAFQSFKGFFFILSSRVGDELMFIVELNTVSDAGQYLGYETFELQQFFFGHVMFLVKGQPNTALGLRSRSRLSLPRMQATASIPRGTSLG
jgi:hypothetical protein